MKQHGVLLIVGGFLLAGATAFSLWLWRRSKVRLAVPPEVVVRQALTRWLDRPNDGNCLDEVSRSVRRYFVVAFELGAGEFTTAEICRALAGNKTGGTELAGRVADFLRECDRRRFAPAADQPPFNAAASALDVVTAAETRRAAGPAPVLSRT